MLEPLLKQAQDQINSKYVAILSVKDSTGNWYAYHTERLVFSEEAVEQAGEEVQPYFFEVTNYGGDEDIVRVAAAYIPDSDLAIRELTDWIQPRGDHLQGGAVQKNKSSSEIKCYFGVSLQFRTVVYEIKYCESSGTVTGSREDDWDWPNPDLGNDEGCPLDCSGGGGSGTGSGGGIGDPLTFNDSCRPGYVKNEYGVCVREERVLAFRGEIKIDSTIINNPKARCVLSRLMNDGSTLAKTIVKFSDETVDLDLKIELADLGPAEGDINGNIVNGSLGGDGSTNTFDLQLNENRISNRTPIEIAATFLHEAIHAEMRRYLDREGGSSTLPGFPGDFTDDWNEFLDLFFEGDVGDGEHETMASKYRSIIVKGLKEFGDSNFTHRDYEAIAWIGLQGTRAYELESESINISDRISNAKDKATTSCE